MNNFTVLLDLDSTIYNLWEPWLEGYNHQFKDNRTIQHITHWNWHDDLEAGSKVYDFLSIPGVFNNLKPFPGAFDAIRKVHGWGIKQVFCSTITGITASAEKAEAVARDFPYIGTKNLVLAGDKSLVKGNLLVDDGPHNIEAFDADGRDTILANMHNAPYCTSTCADFIMTDWKQYPELILNFLGQTRYDG